MRARIYVTQPIAPSALKRLREVARVTMNRDSSRILPKKALCAALPRHDILFSLLHDRVDREVLAANPKLRAVASMAITPDGIDVAEATARGIPVTVVISRDGKVCGKHVGLTSRDRFEAEIKSLL